MSRKKSPSDFHFGSRIGEGSYSSVYKAIDAATRKVYAIKVLSKKHIVKENKIKYVNIEKITLNRLGRHPGIVTLHYTFQDEASLYFVIDFAEYGELLTMIRKLGSLSENCAKYYMCQLIDAVDFMHSRGVIHRDLKPENILVNSDRKIMITDFGAAKVLNLGENGDVIQDDESFQKGSFVGTAEYVSPELLKFNKCGFESDIWALGCILYQFIVGVPPFKGKTEYLTFEKIVSLQYSWPNYFIPELVKDLVSNLLKSNPEERLTISQIQKHNWFSRFNWSDKSKIWAANPPTLEPYRPLVEQQLNSNVNNFQKIYIQKPAIKKNNKKDLLNQIRSGSDSSFIIPSQKRQPSTPSPIYKMNNGSASSIQPPPQQQQSHPQQQLHSQQFQRPNHQQLQKQNIIKPQMGSNAPNNHSSSPSPQKVQQTSSQMVQQPVQQLVQQPAQQPIQQPVQQPAQKPAQQPAQQPIQHPIQQPVLQVQQPVQQQIQQQIQQQVQQPDLPPSRAQQRSIPKSQPLGQLSKIVNSPQPPVQLPKLQTKPSAPIPKIPTPKSTKPPSIPIPVNPSDLPSSISSKLSNLETIIKLDEIYLTELDHENTETGLTDISINTIILKNEKILENKKKLILIMLTNLGNLYVFKIDDKSTKDDRFKFYLKISLTSKFFAMYDYEFNEDELSGYLILEVLKFKKLIFLSPIDDNKTLIRPNENIIISHNEKWIDSLLKVKQLLKGSKNNNSKPKANGSSSAPSIQKRTSSSTSLNSKPKPNANVPKSASPSPSPSPSLAAPTRKSSIPRTLLEKKQQDKKFAGGAAAAAFIKAKR